MMYPILVVQMIDTIMAYQADESEEEGQKDRREIAQEHASSLVQIADSLTEYEANYVMDNLSQLLTDKYKWRREIANRVIVAVRNRKQLVIPASEEDGLDSIVGFARD